jgi:hypothetical protein
MEDWSFLIESRLTAAKILDGGKKIEISLSNSLGVPKEIVLEGVDRFLLTEMREQNIVESVCVWRALDDNGQLQCAVAELVLGNAGVECEESVRQIINGVISSVECGEKILLEIRAIYGAEVLALARAAHLH